MTPFALITPIVAEIAVQPPKFTLAEVATAMTIVGLVVSSAIWFFGTRFVSRDSYDQDRKEVMNQLRACNEALLLTAQTHKELKAVMETLSSNVKENTNVTHSLDKRLAVLEALSKDN